MNFVLRWPIAIAIACLVCSSYSARGQEETVLKDTQGREIKGDIRKVANGEVTIKRSDGRMFTIPISKFELRTQQMLRNWNERVILQRAVGATMKAVEIRAKVHGESDVNVLNFRNSAGSALIDANELSKAIEYLKETVELWSVSRAEKWGAYQAKHLLAYAMLLNKPDPEAGKRFVDSMEGMQKSKADLSNPKIANLFVSQAAERIFQYLEGVDPAKSKQWKQAHEAILEQLKPADSPAIDLGRLKRRTTEHFILASPFSSIGDYTRTAEKTWEELAKVIPTIKSDFEKGDFRTPDGRRAPQEQYGEDGRFRFLLVLADKKTVAPISSAYINTIKDAKKRDAAFSLSSYNGFIEDEHNRFLVARVSDPKDYTDPNDNFTFNRLIHNVPEALIKLTLRTDREPYWLSTGLGYYFENALTGVNSITYSGMNFTEVGLKRYTDWHDPMKKMVENGSRPNMKRVIWGGSRRAEDYGYMWALAEMLLSTPEKQIMLGDFILQRRLNRTFMNEKEVALWFDYDTPEDMGLALTVFIRSKAFR